jgi:hypothetical protein
VPQTTEQLLNLGLILALERELDRRLQSCDRDPGLVLEMVDELAVLLADGEQTIDRPDEDGGTDEREAQSITETHGKDECTRRAETALDRAPLESAAVVPRPVGAGPLPRSLTLPLDGAGLTARKKAGTPPTPGDGQSP